MKLRWLIFATLILLTPVLASAAEPSTTAVRLSELMPSPPRGQKEWIELTNPSSVGELLDGWTIENGRGRLARLSGFIKPWGRVVITKLQANLRNVGDIVRLKDNRGNVIDQVAYGNWVTGNYTSVPGGLNKGEAVARLEYSDSWSLTETPTPGQTNTISIDLPVISATSTLVVATSAKPITSVLPTPKAPPEKKTVTKIATPKKLPAGEQTYVGTVAIPTGVYGKTRMYAVVNGALHELRLSRTPAVAPKSGESVDFIGQERSDATHKWLAVTMASLVVSGTSSEPTFSATSSWPDDVAAIDLTGAVAKIETGKLWIQAGDQTGAVILPSAAKPTSKVGDVVVARGFASPEGPRLYLTNIDGVALVKPASATTTVTTGAPSLPGALSGGLTALVGLIGLLAYLRNEKLKRRAEEAPRNQASS
jgi:hypothetical protein